MHGLQVIRQRPRRNAFAKRSTPVAVLPLASIRSRTRIERLVNQQAALSADSAMCPATYFGTTPRSWLNLLRVILTFTLIKHLSYAFDVVA